MITDLSSVFSKMAGRMRKSEIRELLKMTQRPEIISFAGGLPAPESFQIPELKELAAEVLATDGKAALQYSTTEGETLLRQEIAKRYREKEGLELAIENINIVTSSQQALDFLGRVFIDPCDPVIVGLPSYLGALQAFRTYGADLIGVKLDGEGMRADLLEDKIKELAAAGKKPKFIYTIPDFQNPAGITMSERRRLQIIDIAHRYNVLLIEDSPYREIRFEGKNPPMLYKLDGTEQVITLGTFSKIFVPSFRTGWIIGNREILDKFVTAKQSVDLCTSAFVQKITALYLQRGYFDTGIKKIVDMYREKRDGMLSAFKKYMPEGVHWTEPQGGLFLFITLPEHMDAVELFKKAVEKDVAYVIGNVFHCDGSGRNTMRINFSFASVERNEEGVRRLAQVIKENM